MLLMVLSSAPALATDTEEAPATEGPDTTEVVAEDVVVEDAPAEDAPTEDVPAEEGVVEEVPAFDPTDPEQIFRDIVFPVVGTSSFAPTFGACRDGCTRLHEGV